MKDPLYAVWLAENCGYCSPLGKALVEEFGSCESVYNAERLPKEMGGKRLPRDFGRRCDLQKAQKILAECEEKFITVIGLDDARYPERLASIDNPPVALYAKGKLEILWELDETPALSMVGPRDMTVHGQKAAYDFAYCLAAGGMLIVSGMAEGIDGVSHKGALAAKGKTVAVFGCGLDITYPKMHYYLHEQIEREGLTLSEYPPHTAPHGYHFPQRNRIVTALSGATFLVETKSRSGSLISANLAAEQNRDVYVLMTDYNRRGASAMAGLINDGAAVVSTPMDIVEGYLPRFAKRLERSAIVHAMPPSVPEEEPKRSRVSRKRVKSEKPAVWSSDPVNRAVSAKKPSMPEGLSENAQKIYQALDATDPMHVDELVEKTGLEISAVSAALTELEINDGVKSLPGRHYLAG